MSTPASIPWFVRHEVTLAWRDWMSMMTAGRAVRERVVGLVVLAVIAGLHVLAYSILRAPFAAGINADKPTLMVLTGIALLSFALMLSQAIESITRAFYTRSDLDLILSSPASARHLFAVRIAAIVMSTASLSALIGAPFVTIAILLDGWCWLSVYPAILALAALATALSLAATVAMFCTIGARHTRFVAQVIAAVVGAGFLIGTQVIGILYYGSYSRLAVFQADGIIAGAPGADSIAWIPALALMGQPAALGALFAFASAALILAVVVFSGSFGNWVMEAAGVAENTGRIRTHERPFQVFKASSALRRKEWQLLARDPWLVSQSLMQILYLIPPAVLLWQKYGTEAGVVVILSPVLVMAVGQLAGGLAWLAISGEDAPDLVATAPLPRNAVITAKIQAVLLVIAVTAGPLVLLMISANLWAGLATGLGVAVASASAVAIQLWFQSESRRSNFRRRQTASRTATFAEAFSSILWAGTTAFGAAGSWFAVVFGLLAVIVLALARYASPRGSQ
ncbi:MAG TPA: permease [Hyphomicrobiaceae bacterium]|nr:permease [Hyphomicrobiaceae bacterium]